MVKNLPDLSRVNQRSPQKQPASNFMLQSASRANDGAQRTGGPDNFNLTGQSSSATSNLQGRGQSTLHLDQRLQLREDSGFPSPRLQPQQQLRSNSLQ